MDVRQQQWQEPMKPRHHHHHHHRPHRPVTAAAARPGVWVLVPLLVLVLVLQGPRMCQGEITMVEHDTDVFDIFLSGIKIFEHNASNPMFYIGKARTSFEDSQGNAQINSFVNSRIPLPYMIAYSEEPPLDLELFMDYHHFVRFTVYETDTSPMVLEVTDVGGEVNVMWLRIVADQGERLYGGGQQFSFLDLRGRSFPIWVREQGVGRNKSTLTTFLADQDVGAGGDYHTTPFPQPTFISTRGYSMHHEGPDYCILDFSQPDFHELYVMAERNVSAGRVVFQDGSNVTSLVRHLSEYLGRQPELPAWVHSGAILGVQGGTSQLRARVRQAVESRVAVSAVVIQDWTGSHITSSGEQRPIWNWQWNQTHYPDLPAVIRELKEKGIRVLGYINPYLAKDGPLFAVAEERGFLVLNSANQTFIGAMGVVRYGIVDLSNPDAYDWLKNDVIKVNMIDLGLSGWMADFGQHLPAQGVHLASGQSPEYLHNHWPVLWATLNRQAVEESGKLGELVFWTRAGFSGSANQSTLTWAGDQNVDWSLSDGLPSTLTAALSMAMSGVTLTHFDIGGCTTFAQYRPPLVRSEQLLLRSAEMAVFTPMFRTHEGSQPWANVQFYSSKGTLLKFARLSRMFAAMMNYTRHVVATSAETGLAAQRPLFLNYPDDLPSYEVQYQYMYGDDVLVAPVMEPDVTSHTVYLPFDPATPWVFLWDESVIVMGGNNLTVSAPLGRPPVFYRSISPFVDVFRAVAAEPLVRAPPYIPTTGSPPVTAGGSDGGFGNNLGASLSANMAGLVSVAVVVVLLLGTRYVEVM